MLANPMRKVTAVFTGCPAWIQGLPNRHALTGQGAAEGPGICWYFNAVAAARGL
ncbi:hypothetical protein [Corallococcus sp. CA053C]|uniref:hypothetical protein n=1 Tax=Corallococcus sp. CA053C TaxID=2316732 RepID=UPI0013154E45|nr:hypothetical protein [Corallococcus sp. CA053C]